MKITFAFAWIFVLGTLSAACSTVEYKYVGAGREAIKNIDGHIIGQKEMLRDAETGEQYEHVTYFTPRTNAQGTVVGYEEPSPPGVVLRDLEGRRIGVRYSDLRSRGTNPRSDGVTIIVNRAKPES